MVAAGSELSYTALGLLVSELIRCPHVLIMTIDAQLVIAILTWNQISTTPYNNGQLLKTLVLEQGNRKK